MNDQYITVCKKEFEQINEKLDRMDIALRGNGKPGLGVRVDRLEQSSLRWSRLSWLVAAAVLSSLFSLVVQLVRIS